MPSSSPQALERAAPLFGTLVRLRAEGCAPDAAMAATSAALRVMGDIHRLMSFHEPESELSALNRAAHRSWVAVSAETLAVLTEALAVAAASAGAFDPAMAPLAVRAGTLPRPLGAPEPDPAADWRDVRVDAPAGRVNFARPLWLDLGGVAKGYAVDRAVAELRRRGVRQGCVDAGGDLRVFGPRPEVIGLAPGLATDGATRAVRLVESSLASSGSVSAAADPRRLAAHFDPVLRRRCSRRFVSVVAARCALADALTKVVLARGRAAGGLLAALGARASICSPGLRWSTCGAAPP